MKILLKRIKFGEDYTIGMLYIDNTYMCYTLEDKVRSPGIKIKGQTAIPAGTYKVIVDYSGHFMKMLPHILDVPAFEGIRIHSGNTDVDTEGCILVGDKWDGKDFIGDSVKAFKKVFYYLSGASNKGDTILITISNER